MNVGGVFSKACQEISALVNLARVEILVRSSQRGAMRLRSLVEGWRVQRIDQACGEPNSRHAYDPEQPRIPAGVSEGGRWTTGGNMISPAVPISSDADPVQVAGGGHHYVPRALYRDMQPETQRVFDQARTGPLFAQHHNFGDGHPAYSAAVKDELARFLNSRGIEGHQMTPDQAREFSQQIKTSNDPRIRGFNMRIWRREIRFWMLRAPRGD